MTQTGTLVIAVIGLALSMYNLYDMNQQRKRELRWKKADKAKDMIDEVYENKEAYNAIRVITGSKVTIKVDGKLQLIQYSDFVECFKDLNKESNERNDQLYDMIDEIVYYLDRIENLVEIDFILFADVKPTFEWTVSYLKKNKTEFIAYAKNTGYKKCGEFIARFS